MPVIAEQLHRLMTHGLLDRRRDRTTAHHHCARACGGASTISFARGRDWQGVIMFRRSAVCRSDLLFWRDRGLFRGKHPIPSGLSSNSVLSMIGIWFAILVAAFVAAGVLTQLGWELDPMPTVRRVLQRRRSRGD
jgi:hypothetical protein